MIESLHEVLGGTYKVITSSDTHYLIDLDKMRGKKFIGERTSRFRKDTQWFNLYEYFCRVGTSMFLVTGEIADDPDVITTRLSTPVKEISEFENMP